MLTDLNTGFSLFNGYSQSIVVLFKVIHYLVAFALIVTGIWIYNIKSKLKKRTQELSALNGSLEQRIAAKTMEFEKLSESLLEKNRELDHLNGLLRKEIFIRNKVTELLELNEEKYRSFIHQSGDGIGIINTEGRIIEWNKKMEDITGFKKNEVLDRFMWEVEFELSPLEERTPARKDQIRNRYKHDPSDIRFEVPPVFDQKIFSKHQQIKNISTLLFPISTKSEKLTGCITRDTTSEISHKENEFAAKLLHLVQNIIVVLDAEGRIIRFNEAYEKVTGYSKEELAFYYFWDIHYKKEISSQIRSYFIELLRTKEAYEICTALTSRSGEMRDILWKSSMLNDENGICTHVIFSGTDITESLKKEEELVLSEYKFRQMFEKTLTGVLLYEPILNKDSEITDLRYVGANPAFEEQTGTDPAGIIGKTFREIHGDNETFFIDEYNIFKKTGRYINYEQYLSWLNRYFRMQQFELMPGLMAITFDDVTELKQMEQRMIETVINIEERGHKRIARDLHDDLGPQLASMNVYISSLLRKNIDPEQHEILLLLKTLVKDSIAHVREISNNLSPHVIEKYGLASAINSEIENMKLILPVIFNHQISELRFDPKIEISVYRIVKELLNNTKKYAGASGVILEINSGSNMLTVNYQDDGIGFDPVESAKNGETGMGLLNIESRVKAIRGKFTIKSKPSEGFRFELEVPLNNIM